MDLILAHIDLVYSYAAFFVAYLIGSIPFAVIISKLFGLPDPRTHGSGNPGATNVLRTGNKLAAVLTLILDALKGWGPTFVVQWYSFELGFDDTTVAFVGVAAFLGHLFPVFLLFRGGGKGVATAAGVLLAYEPLLGLSVLIIWGLVAALFRYSSLAAIIASAFAPFFTLLFLDRPSLSLAVSVMSLLLIWRHWRNIVKLLTGKESRIGDKPDETKPRRRRRRAHRLHDEATPLPPSQRSRGN
jgi:glycerol-3-phosphate acyltransferase PlsY